MEPLEIHDMESYDVIIVGLGPAGASCALNLQLLSPDIAARTLIIEKTEHPREKICGGGISANSQALLERLNVKIDVPHVNIDNVRLKCGNKVVTVHEKNIFKVVRRDEFDGSLAGIVKRKGIETHENEKVSGFAKKDNDGIIVKTDMNEYRARIVVGADGVGSVVRRKLLKLPNKKVSRLCLLETPVDIEESPEFKERAVTIDYSYIPHGLRGYVWDVPSYIGGKPFLNRGIFDRRTHNCPGVDIRKIFRIALKSRDIVLNGQKLKWHPEREFDPGDEISIPHAVLVGDAAGIDPLMGEGIAQSLEYGDVAAQEIVRAFKEEKFGFKGYKGTILKTRLGRELMTYKSFADHLYGPNHKFWLSMLMNDKTVPKMLASCFAGRTNLHKYKLKLLGKACRHKLFGDKTLTSITNFDN